MKNTIYLYTFGCKVNRSDTEALEELFINNGIRVVDNEKITENILINTCAVTKNAENKCYKRIRHYLRENKKVFIVGCLTRLKNKLKIENKNAIFIEDFNYNKILNKIFSVKEAKKERNEHQTLKERKFFSIQYGCNSYCSYCIVPYLRGKVRSLEQDYVLKKIKDFINQGYREIVLCGVHLGIYGSERGEDLYSLLKKAVKIKGEYRIRLSSIEPENTGKKLINLALKEEKICNHFHLPLQSASDRILKLMNRKYTISEYEKIIDYIKNKNEYCGITTDIIAGFPGETEEDFLKSYNFLKNKKFSRVHAFRFSPRKNTKAYDLEGKVSNKEKIARVKKFNELNKLLMKSFAKKNLNRLEKIVIESKIIENKYKEGYTSNYIKVIADKNLRTGSLVKIRLDKIYKDYIKGEMVK